MENQVDLSVITDINTLKAMAYDFLVARQQADQNLAMVNQRLEQVLNPKALATAEHPTHPGVSAGSASEPTGDEADDSTTTTTTVAE